MAHWVKVLATKPDYLVLGIYMVERENGFLEVVL